MISSNEASSLLFNSNNNESPPYTPPQSPQLILRDPHRSGLPLQPNIQSNGISDLIANTVSTRIIPKLGSIVKRFSLNYSGEGLVTDRQRTRTVRVGIRFQVQLDAFQNPPPPQILRSQSAPQVEYLDSGFTSPAESLPRLLAIDQGEGRNPVNISIGSEDHSQHSSGVSSQTGSPPLTRRANQPSSLQFHNRINQALNQYRERRSSVQVYRRDSETSEDSNTNQNMEDSSSFQMLRHVPGKSLTSYLL